MKIALFTPGTGHYHCGSCLRDGSLAAALRTIGVEARMIPLYLPMVLEGDSSDLDEPVRMGGINVYLQHRWPLLRRLPSFVADARDAPGLLRWVARHSNMTDPSGLGAMTLSALAGERGPIAAEYSDPELDLMARTPILLSWYQHPPGRLLKVPDSGYPPPVPECPVRTGAPDRLGSRSWAPQ